MPKEIALPVPFTVVPVLNPPRAVETCVDKFLASARIAAAGLPTPATVACQTADDAMIAFEEQGGDVVVKPLFGAEGRGIVRVADPDLAWRTFHAIEHEYRAFLEGIGAVRPLRFIPVSAILGENLAARVAKPLTTSLLTPEYRREMIRVYTKRAVMAASAGSN